MSLLIPFVSLPIARQGTNSLPLREQIVEPFPDGATTSARSSSL
jgi:hypothetical protein